MSGRSRPAITAMLLCVAVQGLIALANTSWADDVSVRKIPSEPGVSLSDVRQLFVPANRPQDWPKGDWEIIEPEEYRELLEELKPAPPRPSNVTIEQARYQAVFTGQNLSAGQLQLRMKQIGRQRMFPLNPLNLAVTSLRWSDNTKPAVWGNTVEERTLLVLPDSHPAHRKDPPQTPMELQGEWSATGRQLSERVAFDLKFAPAAVSELELYLPAGWMLTSSVGQVVGPLEIREAQQSSRIPLQNSSAFKLWRVLLGSETECQLGMSQRQSKPPAKPLVLAESDTTYLVREHELQIEARFELEAAFAPVSQVVFHVPRSINVYAVSYGGDSNVAWSQKPQATQKQVVIQLPDPLLGKSRPIRIQGLTQVQLGRSWPLPRVTCPEASLLRGESHLTVESPLELRSYELSGFRQTAISVQPDQRETLTFAQVASDADASLAAYIGTPALAMSAQLVSYLTTGTEEWQMRTEITWATQSGSRYAASCELLPGWEILDVRRPSESSVPVIADWRLSRREDRTLLTVEFLEALTPMQSKRVQVLARRLPLTAEQTMSLASVKPLGARSVEQFLMVDSEKGDILTSDSSTGVVSWTANSFPPLVQNSSLLPVLNSAGSENDLQSFFLKGLASDDDLSLHRTEPPYDASVNVLAHLTSQHMQESLVFSIDPLNTPLDRLTILAPVFGTGWSWEFLPEQFSSVAIPPPNPLTRDAEIQSANSVRWELRLPSPQSKPFLIRAKRQVDLLPTREVALPYLPAARDFQGTVEVTAPANALLDVRTTFAQEEHLPDRRDPSQTGLLRRWHYQSLDARLSVTHLAEEDASTPLLGRLMLYSLINGHGDANVHRARYELESRSHRFAFPFQLPKNARLIEVRVNGEAVTPRRSEEGDFVDYLPPRQKNFIELRYQTTWDASGITPACAAPIPRADLTLLQFAWRFALSPNLELLHGPSELAMRTPLPSPHWTTRFFGPFAQGSSEAFFAPWSGEAWKSLWKPKPAGDADRQPASRQGFFPAGWTIHEAQGPRASEHVSLVVWNRGLGYQWAWVALLISLTVGFALRLWECSFRRSLGWIWVLVNLAGAGLLPLPWAILCGGGLTGTVIAWLFPRRFLSRSKKRKEQSPIGSTASFPHHSVVGTLLLVGLGLSLIAMAASGDLSPRAVHGQTPATEPTMRNGGQEPDAFNVMIPVDNPRNPQSNADVIFIHRGLLKKLRQAQQNAQALEAYLISSAKYEVEIDSQGSVDLVANFQVSLLASDQAVQVRLPIENVFLGGPKHCLVDGVPHPVLSQPDGPGFFLELFPKKPQGPAVAEKLSAKDFSPASITTHDIRLRLHGLAGFSPSGGRFQFSVPALSASQFRVTLPEAHASIKLRGNEGQILSTTHSKSIQGTMGSAKSFELLWSQQPNELPLPAKSRTTVLALATIHPLWIEWQIRVKDPPHAGQSSALWSLPANTILRSVKSDRLNSFQVLSENGATRLLLEFQDPSKTEYSVDLQAMTPRDLSQPSSSEQVRLPALNLFPTEIANSEAVEAEYLLGVTSTPELAFGPQDWTARTTKDFSALSPDRFLSAYRLAASETLTIRAPQLAWRLLKPAELTLPLQPRLPAKRARLNQEGQFTERELKWNLTAEIETSGAKSFRHVFQVPESFLIDSASIQEDETERLVRWTKTGTRLELILSDGTTGIQNVQISGWHPFEPRAGHQMKLPVIQMQNAEIVDSRLRLFQAETLKHHVSVIEMEDLPLLDDGVVLEENGELQFLAGVRLTDPAIVPSIVVGDATREYRLEKAVLIERESASQNRITTLLHVGDAEPPQYPLQIRLSPSMTRDFHVESLEKPGELVPYETRLNPDQSLDLVFHTVFQSDWGDLRIEALIDAPDTDTWEPPSLQVIGGRVEAQILWLSPEFAIQPDEETDWPRAIRPDEIPPWFRETKTFEELQSVAEAYHPPDAGWRVAPAEASALAKRGECVVHTNIWLTGQEEIAGQTFLRFPAQSLQSISWQWPPGTILQAILLDGKGLFPESDEVNQTLSLRIPSRGEIQQDSSKRLLEIHWSQKLPSPLPRFGHLELSLPKPKDILLEEAVLNVIPSTHARLIPRQGIHPASAREMESGLRAKDNRLVGHLPAESPEWEVSAWTMDSRSESVLLMGVLVLIFGGGMHWGLRLKVGEWLQNHPAVALGLLGSWWWLCFAGSALGFLIFLLSPLLAFSRKTKEPNTRHG